MPNHMLSFLAYYYILKRFLPKQRMQSHFPLEHCRSMTMCQSLYKCVGIVPRIEDSVKEVRT